MTIKIEIIDDFEFKGRTGSMIWAHESLADRAKKLVIKVIVDPISSDENQDKLWFWFRCFNRHDNEILPDRERYGTILKLTRDTMSGSISKWYSGKPGK